MVKHVIWYSGFYMCIQAINAELVKLEFDLFK